LPLSSVDEPLLVSSVDELVSSEDELSPEDDWSLDGLLLSSEELLLLSPAEDDVSLEGK
jgi:hypothetical protein